MLHIKLTEIAHHKKTRIILIKHAVEKLKITSCVTQTLWLLAQGGDDGDVVWLFIGGSLRVKSNLNKRQTEDTNHLYFETFSYRKNHKTPVNNKDKQT